MSFVSVFAMENFITVMSDGLVYDMNSKQEIEQRYQKFKMISPKQFIAYGGNRFMTEIIVNSIEYTDDEKDMLGLANTVRDSLVEHLKPDIAHCQIIIGGIENNEIAFYALNNKDEQEILIHKPTGSNISYGFAYSSESGIDPDGETQRLYPYYKSKSPTGLLKLQKALNDLIAEKDISVNRITFNKAIRK